MIKAILIDDEPLSRAILKSYLVHFPQIQVQEECNDGFEGLKAIQQHQPELIFLDIQMPKINGFEMLELVNPMPAVIFITAFDEFALKAFEANAIDYLLKPVSEERFAKAVQKFLDTTHQRATATTGLLDAMAQTPSQNNRIVVKTGSKVKIIPVHEIHYLEADDDFVKIITAEGAFLKNKTLSFYEQTLDPQQFVRVHRSYLLHIGQITRIEPYQKETHLAILRNGQQIPISKTGYSKLRDLLGI